MTEFRKDDGGKERFDLIPSDAMIALAALYATGAAKYGDNNWRAGANWGRVFAAMMRHAWRWWGGQTHDPVDGQHHLMSVVWCALALYHYQTRGLGTDDRADPPGREDAAADDRDL